MARRRHESGWWKRGERPTASVRESMLAEVADRIRLRRPNYDPERPPSARPPKRRGLSRFLRQRPRAYKGKTAGRTNRPKRSMLGARQRSVKQGK